MKFIWRWFKRAVIGILFGIGLFLSPILYIETMCQGDASNDLYEAILPETYHRLESRTFMTYPEWHIVHAYDNYARVIRTKDPHSFDYFRSVTGFWSSLCAVNEIAASHGGVDRPTKQLVYVIGVSFSVELAFKAAYEETIGRLAAFMRGSTRTALDNLSAQQAAQYATFLQQIPWYRWDFKADVIALQQAKTSAFRDRERAVALGLEFSGKAAYAEVIASAVANVGADELTLRMIVSSVNKERLLDFPAIHIISERAEGVEIETPRYRDLTKILNAMASDAIDFVEIAGNDDILFTALSAQPSHPDAIHSFARQGYGDYRHLIRVKVTQLSATLRALDSDGLTLEHIHDY